MLLTALISVISVLVGIFAEKWFDSLSLKKREKNLALERSYKNIVFPLYILVADHDTKTLRDHESEATGYPFFFYKASKAEEIILSNPDLASLDIVNSYISFIDELYEYDYHGLNNTMDSYEKFSDIVIHEYFELQRKLKS